MENEQTDRSDNAGVDAARNLAQISLSRLLRETNPQDVRRRIDDLEAELRALRVLEQALRSRDAEAGAAGRRPRKRGSTARKIEEFLRRNGPARRSEIAAGADVPSGSIWSALKGLGARKMADGRWTLDVLP